MAGEDVAVRLRNSWQIREIKSGAAVPISVFTFCCSHGLSYRYQNSVLGPKLSVDEPYLIRFLI